MPLRAAFVEYAQCARYHLIIRRVAMAIIAATLDKLLLTMISSMPRFRAATSCRFRLIIFITPNMPARRRAQILRYAPRVAARC